MINKGMICGRYKVLEKAGNAPDGVNENTRKSKRAVYLVQDLEKNEYVYKRSNQIKSLCKKAITKKSNKKYVIIRDCWGKTLYWTGEWYFERPKKLALICSKAYATEKLKRLKQDFPHCEIKMVEHED